jgi:hypothetical protein
VATVLESTSRTFPSPQKFLFQNRHYFVIVQIQKIRHGAVKGLGQGYRVRLQKLSILMLALFYTPSCFGPLAPHLFLDSPSLPPLFFQLTATHLSALRSVLHPEQCPSPASRLTISFFVTPLSVQLPFSSC